MWLLVLLVVLMPLHAFISTWGGTAIGPLWLWKSWKELVLLVFMVLSLGWLVFTPAALKVLLKDRLVLLVIGFLVLSVGMAFMRLDTNGSNATLAGLASDLRYFAVATLAYLLMRFGGMGKPILEKGLRFVGVGAIVLSVIGLLQVSVLPRDLLTHFGYQYGVTIAPYMTVDVLEQGVLRAFATLRGPNEFGAYLLVGLVAVLTTFRSRARLFGALVVASGIAVSHSRSAILGAFIAVCAWVFLQYGVEWVKTFKKQLVVALGVAVVLIAAVSQTDVFRLVVFHSAPGESHLTEGPIDAHAAAIANGVDQVVSNPLGCGPGCAGPASYYGDSPIISENYYLQIAEETGVVGLSLWLGVVCVVGVRLWRQRADRLALALLVSLLGLSFIGLWLHVWADDPLSLTWWILAGGVLGYNESRQWKKSKNTSHSKTS